MTADDDAGRPTLTVRHETPGDVPGVREVTRAAFGHDDEADLVDALRADADAWMDGMSWVGVLPGGRGGPERVVGHALLTRCHVGDVPALCLAPCSVSPDLQRTGVGTAVIRRALDAAREASEDLVVVLGHPGYYPRFGFEPAVPHGVYLSVDLGPDEDSLMVLRLDPVAPVPSGLVRYAPAFGI